MDLRKLQSCHVFRGYTTSSNREVPNFDGEGMEAEGFLVEETPPPVAIRTSLRSRSSKWLGVGGVGLLLRFGLHMGARPI